MLSSLKPLLQYSRRVVGRYVHLHTLVSAMASLSSSLHSTSAACGRKEDNTSSPQKEITILGRETREEPCRECGRGHVEINGGPLSTQLGDRLRSLILRRAVLITSTRASCTTRDRYEDDEKLTRQEPGEDCGHGQQPQYIVPVRNSKDTYCRYVSSSIWSLFLKAVRRGAVSLCCCRFSRGRFDDEEMLVQVQELGVQAPCWNAASPQGKEKNHVGDIIGGDIFTVQGNIGDQDSDPAVPESTATTEDLGCPADPIEVGSISQSEYDLIIWSLCPFLSD